jgi:hypothetical protein
MVTRKPKPFAALLPSSERRIKRSSDPLVALHYQLAVARTEGDLDAIVLADASGVVVAGAGAWPVCEELAAYAPFLVCSDGSTPSVSRRVDALRREVDVRTLTIAGQDVLLCARGARGTPRQSASIERAAAGIERILAAAA